MHRLSTTFRIALGLTLLSCSVLTLAYTLGVGPNEDAALIQGHRELTEVIAIHCSCLLGRKDLPALRHSLQSLIDHRAEVRSIALRKRTGEFLLSVDAAPRGSASAVAAFDNSSVVSFPLLADGVEWGYVDVAFEPLRGGGIRSVLNHPDLRLIVVTTVANLLLFLMYLKKTLQHLDPSRVIPDRVRNVFDTIAEGLVVLDNRERIVLANKAFANTVGMPANDLVGRSLSRFRWSHGSGASLPGSEPWRESHEKGLPVSGVPLRLMGDREEDTRYYTVNASPIIADDGARRGTLVSFEDLTEIEKHRVELNRALEYVRASRDEIRKQNDELRQLATRDPLTGCQNRRSFYEALEIHWHTSQRRGHALGMLMVDVDHFKSINDKHGHSTGDLVLQQVAVTLRDTARMGDLVCRYGGEEFCVLMPGATLEDGASTAEQLRAAVESLKFPDLAVTVSLGVACSTLGAENVQQLIDQADKSLYVAKRSGRNRVERYAPDSPEFAAALAAPDDRGRKESTAPHDLPDIPYHAVSALLSALSFRDLATAEHSRRVADLCVQAVSGTMSARDRYVLETAALLHDIGKVGVPDSVLLKPGPLSREEWRIMSIHDRMGHEIIASAFACPALSEIVENHHAWFTGNPREPGLPTGEQIPFGARLLAIADAYDAIVSNGVYRAARSQEAAFCELRRCAGAQFDPQLVEQFIDAIEELPHDRVRSLSNVSREAAVLIGQRMERLAHSLDQRDMRGLSILAGRIHQTAQQHTIPDLAEAAAELERAVAAESELPKICELTDDLLELCRATQSAFTQRIPHNFGTSA